MSPWRRTLWVSWIAQFVSLTGFMMVMPLLPFYIRELGVTGDQDVRMWAGVSSAAAAVTLAIFSPIWGHVADKYGRKLMVIRSLFGGAIVIGLMSVVWNVQQLALCRLLQGALTGTVAASTALVASVAPPNRSVFALGRLQTALYSALCLGPWVGGILAAEIGYRPTFRIACGLVVVAALLAAFALREEFSPPTPSEKKEDASFRRILQVGGFLAAILVFVAIRFGNMVQAPVFPLFVEELLGADAAQLKEKINGQIFMVMGLGAALCSFNVHALTARWGERKALMLFAVLAAGVMVLHASVTKVIHLFILRALLGAAMAGTMVHVNAMIRGLTHDKNVGKAFGAAWGLGCVGWVIGSLCGGFLSAHYGLRSVFYVTGGCLCLAALIVLWRVKESAPAPVDAG